MQNKLVRLASKLTTVAMVVSMLGMSMPAGAAPLTLMSDAMSTLKTGVSATHVVTFTLATAVPVAGTITVTLPAGTNWTAAGTATCTGGTLTNGIATNVLTSTVSAAPCTGVVTITGAAAINPAAGPMTVALATSAGDSGSIYTYIVTNDTIHVTADVSQTFTYDIQAAASCATAVNGGVYAIPLGTLTPDTPKNSSAIAHVCMKLKTNASSGAVVQVKDLYSGLRSDVDNLYFLSSLTEDLSAAPTGNKGFGICGAVDNHVGVGDVINRNAIYSSACNSVGAVSNASWTEVANTATNPIDGGSTAGFYDAVQVDVAARATTSSPSGTYQDDLYFRAFATF